jgi:hypothetical protein
MPYFLRVIKSGRFIVDTLYNLQLCEQIFVIYITLNLSKWHLC